MNIFKPLLAPNQTVDLDTIKYPVLVSPKMDGIRCIFKDGEMLSRSLKPIRNKQLQEKFSRIKKLTMYEIIFDGELYSHELTFQEITSIVMSEDKDVPDSLKFYCFDFINNIEVPFVERINNLKSMKVEEVMVVKQDLVLNKLDLYTLFENVLKEGYEGLMLRDPEGRYKFGRATIKEGIIYKMKPYMDFDGVVIDVEERMENTSESYTNELGHSQKHRCKADMRPTGIASALIVNTEDFGEQKVSLTGTEDFRKEIWNNRYNYINKWIKFKGMVVGAKDKIRHPVFLSWRDEK